MQIKRFKAKDMSEGMLMIKRDLGRDAIILSSRKIKDTDGSSVMEITAAVEKVAPKAEPKDLFAREEILQPTLPTEKSSIAKDLSDKLLKHGVEGEIHQKIDTAVEAFTGSGFSDFDALDMVLGKMVPFTTPVKALERGKIHVFVGPTGAGKTTTIAKLAVQKKLEHYSIGLLSFDNQKVAGFEQLNIFGNALKENCFLLQDPKDFMAASVSLGPKDFIFVDTAGFNPFKKADLLHLKKLIEQLGENVDVHLVLPCTMNTQEMSYIPAAVECLSPKNVIFTKMDETSHLGGMANVAAMSGLNVCFATDGTHVPQNIVEMDSAILAKKLMKTPHFPWEKEDK
jgi:flagellar biosynthesis protein FlhF